jgi:ligand-binding SRPBCC domain-containing protein
MKHTLIFNQALDAPLDDVWAFFTNPYNLSKITPKNMRFEIKTKGLGSTISKGTIIDYIVTPFFDIPLNWRTEITEVVQNKVFADKQIKGPYKFWLHTHTFTASNEIILMEDKIEYELPFSPLTDKVIGSVIHNRLQQIFLYRKEILEQIFNQR